MCGTAGCDVITKADVSTGLHGGDDQRVHPAPTITCIGERTPAAEVGLAFHPASPSATGVQLLGWSANGRGASGSTDVASCMRPFSFGRLATRRKICSTTSTPRSRSLSSRTVTTASRWSTICSRVSVPRVTFVIREPTRSSSRRTASLRALRFVSSKSSASTDCRSKARSLWARWQRTT